MGTHGAVARLAVSVTTTGHRRPGLQQSPRQALAAVCVVWPGTPCAVRKVDAAWRGLCMLGRGGFCGRALSERRDIWDSPATPKSRACLEKGSLGWWLGERCREVLGRVGLGLRPAPGWGWGGVPRAGQVTVRGSSQGSLTPHFSPGKHCVLITFPFWVVFRSSSQ